MSSDSLYNSFFEKYGNRTEKPVLFFSPGRVNLIGEHTDYNGGFVFPCALNYGTYLLIRLVNDYSIKFSTLNFNKDELILLAPKFENKYKTWINYPLGVMNEFLERGIQLQGMELMFFGDVPNGAGLSSSASIEMVTAVALNELYSAGFQTLDLVKMSQSAENNFVGMNCGIMDQFAVGFGKKDHAIFLNCDSLAYENVPLSLGDHSLVITNTNKRRGLTDSKYNERRSECDKAVDYLQAYRKIKNLSEVKVSEADVLEQYIPDLVVRQRARHVITENGRVEEAVKVLKANDLRRFGELMNLSHDSLRADYEVTGIELDTLVYEARKIEGVIGSRMTGAGFGGCTVSIVRTDKLATFTETLAKNYTEKTGLVPDFYRPEIGNGAGRLA
ncbi:MAG: galactokinase [Bacteroidales bacterium]